MLPYTLCVCFCYLFLLKTGCSPLHYRSLLVQRELTVSFHVEVRECERFPCVSYIISKTEDLFIFFSLLSVCFLISAGSV